MKSRITVFVMPVLALCIGGGLLDGTEKGRYRLTKYPLFMQ
jgi:hypothetical protein